MGKYKVVNLSENEMYEYLCCLKTWDEGFYSDRKRRWYNKKVRKGLCVKIIKDEKENVLGMVQYLPAEESFVEGEDVYLIQCIWIQGYDKGTGNVQKRGLGTLLLNAVEKDVKDKGANALIAWGMSFEEWMPASWYIKHGYTEIDRDGIRILVWKTFKDDVAKPKFIKRKKLPDTIKDKVLVNVFNDGWCQDLNIESDLTKKIVKEYGEKVVYKEYDTSDKKVLKEWGIDNAILVDKEWLTFGPYSVEEQLRELIEEKIKQLRLLF
ncbi:MAG: GNAT family N-acetyltransferase [Firmicutes bacterium]|nr:GNAT family N-acetyltransferase [Bacillota bacterium]